MQHPLPLTPDKSEEKLQKKHFNREKTRVISEGCLSQDGQKCCMQQSTSIKEQYLKHSPIYSFMSFMLKFVHPVRIVVYLI